MAHEIEIKLAVSSVAAIRRRVRGLGFAVTSPRQLEQNLLFEASDNSLSRSGQLLRLRSKGKRWWLTWKGQAGGLSRHKIRHEIETELMDGEQMQQVLIRLGFQPAFEYDKYRTEFQKLGEPGKLLLDETPIGDFIELEGEPSWIDRVARELGYTAGDYVLASYGLLFLRWRQERGLPPQDMVFERKKTLRRFKA